MLDKTGTRLIKVNPENINQDGSFNVPDGVTHIGDRAFYECSSLTQINLPQGITHIGVGTFINCSSLAQINLPQGIAHIGSSAFADCSRLAQINLPQGITHIGSGAFYNCSSLTQINLPQGITRIGDNAFFKCSSLTEINLPRGINYIGYRAFAWCSSLTQINLPQGITRIRELAFHECTSLTQIILPESLTQIRDDTFAGSNYLIAINTEDPEHFARIQGLLSQTDRERLLPIKLVSKINQTQQQAINRVLNQPEASVLYHPQKNESIPKLPTDIHALINSYVVDDNPYLKKLQRQMDQIPFPQNEQELPRYQTDIDRLAKAACEAAQESYRPTPPGIFQRILNYAATFFTTPQNTTAPDQIEIEKEENTQPAIYRTTSQSNSRLGIFKPAQNETQSTSTNSEEKSDPNQKEEEDDNRPII